MDPDEAQRILDERAAAEAARLAAERAALSVAARVAREEAATGASADEIVSAAKYAYENPEEARERLPKLEPGETMDEAARAELAAVVKRIVLMRCEREGQSEEEGEKAAEDSVGVLFAALDDGVPSACLLYTSPSPRDRG